MWVLILLGIFAASVGFSVRQRIRALRQLEIREALRDAADAGVKLASNTIKMRYGKELPFDALNQSWSRDKTTFHDVTLGQAAYSVYYDTPDGPIYGVVDEERKINLNKTNAPKTLADLIELGLGLDKSTARVIAESIIDWRDKDDFPGAQGAESRYYKTYVTPSYTVKNADFDVLEELLWVKGVTPEIYEALRRFVTLNSSGHININTAPYPVLRALGFGEQLAKKILLYREGVDKKAGTSDDQAFVDLSAAVEALNQFHALNDDERQSLTDFIGSGALSVTSTYFTIRSEARMKERSESLTVRCLIDTSGNVIRWHEYYSSTLAQ